METMSNNVEKPASNFTLDAPKIPNFVHRCLNDAAGMPEQSSRGRKKLHLICKLIILKEIILHN